MVTLESMVRGYKIHYLSRRTYGYILEQEKDPANEGNNGTVVVGLNKGGREIVEVLEEMFENYEKALYFSLLSVSKDQIPVWEGGGWSEPNLHYKLEGKLVVLVDYEINAGESALLALNELVHNGRPKYVRLAVIKSNFGERQYPIKPDRILSL